MQISEDVERRIADAVREKIIEAVRERVTETIRERVGTRQPGEPAWEVALLFPNQGAWSEEEYLALNGNRLVEFSHGFIEVLPMPTTTHQLIVVFLFDALRAFVAALRIICWRSAICCASLGARPTFLFFRQTRCLLRRNNSKAPATSSSATRRG